MFDLPTDIAVTVLDYITAVNDLKALCLTSKACHERVIPRLYRHVNIPLWHHSVLTFSRQFHSGESNYLKHTRTLVIEHQEIANPLKGYAPEDKDKPDSSTVKQEEDMRMVTLMEVLQLFPRDVLRDFRFVSTRCLPLVALQWLSINQRGIDKLHSSFIEESLPVYAVYPVDVFMKVRHLDLHVHREPSIFGNFLHHLVSNSSPIEILCLTGDMYQSHWSEVHQYLLSATEGLDADAVNTIMPRLRELSFCGFDLSLPWLPALRKIVDFAKLTKLYVTKCDAASAFLHDLASIAEIKMFRLEHLAVDALNESSYHYDDEAASASASAEAIDKCMANIVRESSRGLKTLHLGWHEHYEDGQGQTNILIRNLLDEICSSHGESLRILGLHTHNYADYEEGVEALSPEDLERVCRACPKIEELGYQLGSGVLDGDTEDGDALDAFVQNIALLPSLHTLHLRFPHELEVSGFDPYRYDPDERPEYMEGLAKELRLVARKIFSKLEAYQTTKGEGGREDRRNRLEKIVIGHLTTLRQHTSKCSLPQHCFVRGGFEEGGKIVGGYSDDKEDMQEEDDSGGDDDNVNGEGDSGDHGDTSSVEPQNCEVAAKPVLRSTLRRMRLNTRVLDIDVGVEPFEQWARRAL